MISKKEFTDAVEKLVIRGSDVLSAIIKVCEDNNLEPEASKRLISAPLKEKLQAEAKGLNLINRGENSVGTITKFFSV
jgi:hypothetical protein|tara:strand:+ start:292 stop:525 length:234 start_codon:yes stop_codon:yes gene_type:complete